MQILAGTTSPWGAGLTLKWTAPAMELIMTVRECMQQKVPLHHTGLHGLSPGANHNHYPKSPGLEP